MEIPGKPELERVYTVNLREAYEKPRTKRAKVAVNLLKEFMKRHMKAEEVKLSNMLNAVLWSRGIQKPPRKVKVKAFKVGNTAYVFHFEEKVEIKEKKEEKKEEKKGEEKQ